MDKKKILVIDDEQEFTNLVRLNLEATGRFEVRTENKGSAVLEAVDEFAPDLILLDIKMPEMDGGVVAGKLRSNDKTKHIPIVFVTALVTDQDVKSRGGIIGGHYYIAKPIDTKELISVIEKSIGRT